MHPWEFKKRLKEVLDTVPPEDWKYTAGFSTDGFAGCLLQRMVPNGASFKTNVLIGRYFYGIDSVILGVVMWASDNHDRGVALSIWTSLPDGPPAAPKENPLPSTDTALEAVEVKNGQPSTPLAAQDGWTETVYHLWEANGRFQALPEACQGQPELR